MTKPCDPGCQKHLTHTRPDPTSSPPESRTKTRPCGIIALFRYTWPGSLETQVCVVHARQAQLVAGAMGFPLQVIPVTTVDITEIQYCPIEVKVDGDSEEQL